MIVCLACRAAAVDDLTTLAPQLVAVTPRVVVEPRGIVWCDAQGLDARAVAGGALAAARTAEASRAGVAQTPVAAEVAAVAGIARANPARAVEPAPAVTIVPRGADAEFLAPHPIEVLEPSPPVCTLLRGSGIEKCGDLAGLDHESVEVRFGAEGSRLWRLARADDRRRIFPPMTRALPESSLEWVDYVLAEPERLLFVINALVGNVCAQLAERGVGAREIALVFSLASRSTYEHRLRPARVTASQRAWMRLVRSELERIALPDAVTGIAARVLSVAGEPARQGDLFDRGFATARVTEEAVAQLLDDGGVTIVAPRNSAHPLVERRTEWLAQDAAAATTSLVRAISASPRLTLQLLAEPRQVLVETERRRDHEIPVRCCLEGGWVEITTAAGPDRVSGGEWESVFAREYYRCITSSGRLVWIFREDGGGGGGGGGGARWFFHGWWD